MRELRPSTGASPARQDAKDALQLLMAEHREVKAMFRQYARLADAGGRGDARMLLASRICVALTLHAQTEEELVYPAARDALPGDEELVDEAVVEHAGARTLVAQIKTMTSDQPLYDAKLKVLGDYVDHHVRAEEEELFPKLRRSTLDLDALAERIAERRKRLMARPEPS
jgi:hemerythrin superfamily protein